MLFNLLYKELRLAAHPNLFIFTLMSFLLFVPAYPYGMIFLFSCIGVYVSFMYGRETNDLYYTALLPLEKSAVVKAKCSLVIVAQLAQLLIALPITVIKILWIHTNNPVGIEGNVAFYGFGLMIYGLFNLLFLPEFFRSGHKVGKAFIIAAVPVSLAVIVMEVLVHFPAFSWLDQTDSAALIRQLPLLAAGAAFYLGSNFLTYRISKKHFAKVDL